MSESIPGTLQPKHARATEEFGHAEVFGGSMSALSRVLLYDHWALTHFLRLARTSPYFVFATCKGFPKSGVHVDSILRNSAMFGHNLH